MEIKFSGNVNDYLKETYRIVWKLHLTKTIIYLLCTFLIGIVMMVIGLTSNYDMSISSTRYDDNATLSITNTTFYKTHFILGLGIAFSIFSLYVFLIILYQRKKLIRSRARRKESSGEYFIIINENEISYHDPELNRTEKWSIFWKYKIYKKYTLLLRNESYWESTNIPLDRIPQNECEEFLKFLKRTLPQIK